MYINPQMMDIIKDCKLIDSGFQGTCYHDDKYVYKVYSAPLEHKLETIGYQSNLIAFPIEVYTDCGTIIGYKMKYFNAKHFADGMDDEVKLKDVRESYSNLAKEIQNFDQFEMLDLIPTNVLFDNKKFYLIDTDDWYLNYNSFTNKRRLNYSINTGLVNSLPSVYYRVLNNHLDVSTERMLDEMILMYHAIYGENPETIGDFKKKI